MKQVTTATITVISPNISANTLCQRQFKNPIFVILIAAAIVAGFFAQPDQSISIISMIILSVVLGFYNEYKAEKIVDKLKKSVS
jgi:Ca2+-transporting ATPase